MQTLPKIKSFLTLAPFRRVPPLGWIALTTRWYYIRNGSIKLNKERQWKLLLTTPPNTFALAPYVMLKIR